MLGNLTKSALRHYLLGLPPPQRLARYSWLLNVRWFRLALKEIKPDVLPEAAEAAEAEPAVQLNCIQPPAGHYHQYRCVEGSPLSCSQTAVSTGLCEQCYFPALLAPETLLTGKQGQYQIGPNLGRRGIGRLYAATKLGSEQPVMVQEYLLPERYFSPAEQRQYQDAFTGLAGLALADGRTQDLRIVPPIEAINDPVGNRCYLVSPVVDGAPTLNRVCAQTGALSNAAVLNILNQVLQTLTFLHEQKFSLPTGQVQTGIIHGNLSLDSLLWVGDETAPGSDRGYVYLTDFALWEKLFDPALTDRGPFAPQQDLAALGQVAFWLLNGTTVSYQGQQLTPRVSSDWPTSVYPPLKLFILQLLGIEPPFAHVEAARQALLGLPPAPTVNVVEARTAEAALVKKPWYRRYLPALVTVALLTVFGSIIWLVLKSRRPIYAETLLPPCCLDAVNAVPTGEFTYAMPRSAYWYPLFRAVSEDGLYIETDSWFTQVAAVHPELSFESVVVGDVARAIAAVQTGEADFTIVPVTKPLPPDITATVIAYDSLVPVVAFSYPDRQKGLPDELEGRLRMDQLAQIYTGTFDSWQQLQATSLPIRRYWAEDPTVQTIFTDRILEAEDDFTDKTVPDSFVSSRVQPRTLPALAMLRQILQDFENNTVGSIGIGPLSEALGQCSVYPLALTVGGSTVSPLVLKEGAPVEPEVDLCDRKGSYFANADALREGTYPLAYPLAVVYPFDNTRSDVGKRVAALLLTQEGQRYLKNSGMVTVYPLKALASEE